jgi:sporulation protein YlmC with PRC-barrel domain
MPHDLALVRDVLDKQLIDRNGLRCGKVDGIVLDTSGNGPPRVAFLQSGPVTLARRLGAWPARIAAWVARGGPRGGEPYRIPWSRVSAVGREVKVDLDAERSKLLAGEHWLRHRVVEKLGGK